MEGAFRNVGNHMVGNSASAINEGDDISTLDAGESALDSEYGRGNLSGGPRRRRVGDDDETPSPNIPSPKAEGKGHGQPPAGPSGQVIIRTTLYASVDLVLSFPTILSSSGIHT